MTAETELAGIRKANGRSKHGDLGLLREPVDVPVLVTLHGPGVGSPCQPTFRL